MRHSPRTYEEDYSGIKAWYLLCNKNKSLPVNTPCRFHIGKKQQQAKQKWLTPVLKVTADVAVQIKVFHVTVSGDYRTWTLADTLQPAATRTVTLLVSPIPRQLNNLLSTFTHAHTNYGFTKGFGHWREGERERESEREREREGGGGVTIPCSATSTFLRWNCSGLIFGGLFKGDNNTNSNFFLATRTFMFFFLKLI